MTAYTIARPINGIPLNGDEYIRDCCGRYIVFETEFEAEISMLNRFAADVIDEQGIYVKEINLEDLQ